MNVELTTPHPSRLERIQALYRRVPRLVCKGRCASSCGVIMLQASEYEAIRKVRDIPETSGLACPLLDRGRCTVYDMRPLICRIWGTVRDANAPLMRCPWGCRPKRWLTDVEGRALIAEALAIDPDARSLQSWLDVKIRRSASVLTPER